MPFDPSDIQRRLDNVDSLPTLPGVVRQLMEMVEEDGVSTQEIGRIIGSDQVISSRVLKIVNSAFYGFPGRITTVTHALVLLGFNVVKGLVLSASVIDIMSRGMVGLWEHSFGVAVASGCVARRIGEPDPEEASVAGLLHDLGKVILALDFKDVRSEATAIVDARPVSLHEAERAVMGGISHANVGAWTGAVWNLPVRIREAMEFHHRPLAARHEQRVVCIVHVADALARGLALGDGGDRFVPLVDERAFASLGLPVAELPDLIDEIETSYEESNCSAFAE